MQDMGAGSSSDEEVHIYPQAHSATPLKATSTQASGGNRVHVTTSEEKPDEDAVSMWSFEYYQQFFDVDTTEVMWRCLRSLWPFKLNFIQFVRTNPDFYGPFWITTTLIFMLAAGSNFATYLHNPAGWYYNFFTLTTGAGIIWGYAFGMPVLLWLYFKWVDLNVSLIEMFCIYGYSLFSYTPVAVLCIIPIMYVQWVVVIIACLISTSFLIVNMWTPLRSKVGHAVFVLIIMGCFHVALGLCVQLYWFQFYSQPPQPAPAPQPTPVPSPSAPFAPVTPVPPQFHFEASSP